METSGDLQGYRERLDDEVKPVLNLVFNYLVASSHDLNAAETLGVALNNWKRIDQEFKLNFID
jgi:hypothetical protein